MVPLFHTGTHLDLVTLVLTLASSVPVTLAPPVPHLELVTLIFIIASPDLVTVVPTGTSPGPHVSGPHLGPVSYTHLTLPTKRIV